MVVCLFSAGTQTEGGSQFGGRRVLSRVVTRRSEAVAEIERCGVTIRVYRLDNISSDVVLLVTVDPAGNAAAIIEQCAGGPGDVAARCVTGSEAAVQPADARSIDQQRMIRAVVVKVVFVERLGALGSAGVEDLLLERQVADVNVGVS